MRHFPFFLSYHFELGMYFTLTAHLSLDHVSSAHHHIRLAAVTVENTGPEVCRLVFLIWKTGTVPSSGAWVRIH